MWLAARWTRVALGISGGREVVVEPEVVEP